MRLLAGLKNSIGSARSERANLFFYEGTIPTREEQDIKGYQSGTATTFNLKPFMDSRKPDLLVHLQTVDTLAPSSALTGHADLFSMDVFYANKTNITQSHYKDGQPTWALLTFGFPVVTLYMFFNVGTDIKCMPTVYTQGNIIYPYPLNMNKESLNESGKRKQLLQSALSGSIDVAKGIQHLVSSRV